MTWNYGPNKSWLNDYVPGDIRGSIVHMVPRHYAFSYFTQGRVTVLSPNDGLYAVNHATNTRDTVDAHDVFRLVQYAVDRLPHIAQELGLADEDETQADMIDDFCGQFAQGLILQRRDNRWTRRTPAFSEPEIDRMVECIQPLYQVVR